MSQNRTIYLDHAATTPVDGRVLDKMLPYLKDIYGNPSSSHRSGQRASRALSWARNTVAEALGANPSEVVFTSCGTESDNLALRGVVFSRWARGKHIITSHIEHHAVENTCLQLAERFGYEITFLPVDRYGRVAPEQVREAIRPDTALISIMYANNEIGTVQPIADIGLIAREHDIPFHTDAVQAPGQLPLDVGALHVDLMSLSGHKFYAPKGVGVLYVREGLDLLPVQTGGKQEHGLRAGTQNVPYIVALAEGLSLAVDEREEEADRVRGLRDRLIDELVNSIDGCHLTGHPRRRLPNNASFVFEGVDGEAVQMHLSMAGIATSTGSACASGEDEPSHVLRALDMDPRLAQGSLRLSLGRATTEDDIERTIAKLSPIVEKLRDMSLF